MFAIRNMIRRTFFVLAVAQQLSAFPVEAADLVLTNGVIYTVNASQPFAQAIAIENGKIVLVGTDRDVDRHIYATTKVVDLEGRFVMPGIHDVHMHPLEANNPAVGGCILTAGSKVAKHLDTIRRCAKQNKTTDWVLGWGHSGDDVLGTNRPPAKLLDEVVPNRPAIIMEFTSHSMWVNSRALELANITANTPNPPAV